MRPFSEFHVDSCPEDIVRADQARLRSLATWAYLVLRPGMEFVRQRSNFILGWEAAGRARAELAEGASAGAVGSAGVPPVGSWMILPQLTGPATQTVLPSNDALYGAAHVELDLLGPVVLTVPPNIDGRYYSVAVMDAHLNNVAHIGPRWTGNGRGLFVVVPPGWSHPVPPRMQVIESPTVSVCLYNRMLVGYEAGDADRVRAWQAGLGITQLSRWGSGDVSPEPVPTGDFVYPDLDTLTDPFAYLRIGLAHLARNPLVPAAGWLAPLIAHAGLIEAATDPGTRQAVSDGVDDGTRMLDATLTRWPRSNGWMIPNPSLGKPNPLVVQSAAFQQFQIGSNDISESAYWFVDDDAQGHPLDASSGAVYTLTFGPSQLPPVHDGGYWSLTMYNEHSLLVDNPIHRYATRPDRPGTVRNPDGGLTFTLSATRPDQVPEANWLPAPSGRFRLGLRAYYPAAPIIEGRWAPPPVVRSP